MKRKQPLSGCCVPCGFVSWGSSCSHHLLLNGSVWGVHPSGPSTALPVRQQTLGQCSGGSTADLFATAPQSDPLWGCPPTNRVQRFPSRTGCVKMTASGLSGAFLLKTCPRRFSKMKIIKKKNLPYKYWDVEVEALHKLWKYHHVTLTKWKTIGTSNF